MISEYISGFRSVFLMVYKPYMAISFRIASLVLLKNSTFSGFGFRAVQVGLQKIPVVLRHPKRLRNLHLY